MRLKSDWQNEAASRFFPSQFTSSEIDSLKLATGTSIAIVALAEIRKSWRLSIQILERVSKPSSVSSYKADALDLERLEEPGFLLRICLWNKTLKNSTAHFKKTRKTISLLLVICALVIANLWAGKMIDHLIPSFVTPTAYGMQTEELVFEQGASSLVTSSEVDTKWRRTKDGWQDSTTWPSGDHFSPIKSFESVHPFVWAAIVLFSVIATMIWASSEWEISQLFEEEQTNDA